jgi:site-specific DNA-methyltransferase (adenine-specific)
MNEVICGDCTEELKKLPDNSVDSIVTDPPYGLEFMGKEWDKFKEGKNIAGGTTGIDTPYGRKRALPAFYQIDTNGYQDFSFKWATEALRVLKPGGYLLSFGGTRTYHRMTCAIEDAGFEIRDCIFWTYASGFPKSLNIGKAIAKKQGAKKQGAKKQGAGSVGNAFPLNPEYQDYELTEDAKQWEGWGTALKPAVEPIVVARKPLSEKNVASNVLKWGTGGINIDGSRVGTEQVSAHHAPKGTFAGGEPRESDKNYYDNLGRFPANLIHDGSDEVVSGFPNDASRFFYVAKASRSERNMGLEGFEEKPSQLNSGGIGREKSVEKRLEKEGENAPTMKNVHPTVKPLKLMEYLVKLVTPPKGICLDPFLGSGTTAMACKRLGFNYIGIEKDPEYCKIAEARVTAIKEETRLL